MALLGWDRMLAFENEREGIPVTLYRTPSEIRRDMASIRRQIEDADEMLCVRNVLTEIIDEFASAEPARWISELEETVAEARAALERLMRLEDALSLLAVELEEAKWAMHNC